MLSMKGRTVLVAGTGPNIGQAVVKVFATAGAKVVCNDIDPNNAAAGARIAKEAGSQGIAVTADISKPDQVAGMLDTAEKAFGVVDTLINNGAITINKGLLNISIEEWLRVVDITLTGPFLCGKAMAERLIAAKKKGVIINVASSSGHRGRGNAVAYCAAKGGVLNLTRAMAIDLAPHGIRVCSVSPTRTGTPVGQQQATGRPYADIPLGRLGRPEDQAYAMLFMASDEADFITGQDLLVDGGSLATWAVKT